LISPLKARSFFLVALFAFLIELTLYFMIKFNVKRERPFHAMAFVKQRIHIPDRFSFPSGHTSAAFVMAGLLSHFFPVVMIPAYSWASLVGLSRVYLGVHYPADVLAGMVIGVISSFTGLTLLGF